MPIKHGIERGNKAAEIRALRRRRDKLDKEHDEITARIVELADEIQEWDDRMAREGRRPLFRR